MGITQKAVDNIARGFYSALAIAGCISSFGFVALGVYGAVTENTVKHRLFFAGLAAVGVWVGSLGVHLFKYVQTHNDLPETD